ncbi:flagellar basal body rod protein FlgF [Acetobacter malorum DSM 14337]|uniref:Flagellar basal-body rod protein FlgF n=1 Tax=Acetobacter malorum DSM 14337 TaxID=1307910 RepID=A0ABQ0Q0U9_9PROT|nr:flagellar basal-body rod protein FlgF [Acetobacter malorum]KXV06464.1 flagellar biosynthesis protein FlgF [Acetobacter malorum]GBQ86379.1 flagellar basal body rod protein FlgF [Acetobacter malorum DSM 14337]
MDNTSYLSLSRIDGLTRALDVTANNLANASTDGFKESRVQFADYLSKQKGTQGAAGEKQLQYSQDRATYHNFDQGALRQTGNTLDLGLNGEGYFTVRTKNGIRLTRNGQFLRSDDGTITDSAGNPLLDQEGRNIRMDPEEVMEPLSISSGGIISTNRNGALAQIAVVNVENQNTLKAEGSDLYNPTTPTTAVASPEIRQGMLEASNVNAVQETTEMIRIQRAYDLNFQVVQTESTRQLDAISKITSEPNV